MMHAHRLLQSYVQEGSQEAFQEIVVGHLSLVYGVALRCLNGDAALAEDACQLVFQSLAQKARSLPPDTIMTGWLYRHAYHTASRMARAEKRRHLREKRAAADLATTGNEGPDSTDAAEQAAARLLACLPNQDRAALLLRFYEDRSFREIGETLGVSEDAAQKRVTRAIEKLRSKLTKVGTGSATSALTAYLTSIGATQVPAILASRILASAAGGAATTSGLTALATITTTLFTMKTKAILIAAAVIAVSVPILLTVRSTKDIVAPQAISSPEPAIPLPMPPAIPPGNTQSEIWDRIKKDPARLGEVVEQTTTMAKRMLDVMQQALRSKITAWQKKQIVISDPEIEEANRDSAQTEANHLQLDAKELEAMVEDWRQRMEAYLSAMKGTPIEGDTTIQSMLSRIVRQRFQRIETADPGTDAPELEALWKEHFRANRKGEFETAESIGLKMIELDPDSAAGYIAVAQTMIQTGEMDDVKEALSATHMKFPDAVEVAYLSGLLSFIEGDYKAAQEIFEEVATAITPETELRVAGVRVEARLSSLLNADPEIQALLDRDLADIPPVEYMRFEKRLAEEFGDPMVVDAWDAAIRDFGSLQAPEPKTDGTDDKLDGKLVIDIK
ncbi:MAG: sigma-70 family RNA polymerase sigma factor [Verrucomicrobiales bacterium]